MDVTILTGAYNKPRHLIEAGESVLAQTYSDWVWWIVLNGPTPEVQAVARSLAERDARIQVFEEPTSPKRRKQFYLPSIIWNKYTALMTCDAVLWLSDDDLLAPACLATAAAAWDGSACVYWRLSVERELANGDRELMRVLPEEQCRFGLGGEDPCCKLDGGQVLLPLALLRRVGWTMPEPRSKLSRKVDGLLLRAIAPHAEFRLCSPEILVVHRCTSLSEHCTGS